MLVYVILLVLCFLNKFLKINSVDLLLQIFKNFFKNYVKKLKYKILLAKKLKINFEDSFLKKLFLLNCTYNSFFTIFLGLKKFHDFFNTKLMGNYLTNFFTKNTEKNNFLVSFNKNSNLTFFLYFALKKIKYYFFFYYSLVPNLFFSKKVLVEIVKSQLNQTILQLKIRSFLLKNNNSCLLTKNYNIFSKKYYFGEKIFHNNNSFSLKDNYFIKNFILSKLSDLNLFANHFSYVSLNEFSLKNLFFVRNYNLFKKIMILSDRKSVV